MKTAETMTELRELLASSEPGDIVEIKGYVDSAGRKQNIIVVRLAPDGYRKMQLNALEKLTDASFSEDEQSVADAMVASLNNSLYGPPKGEFKDVYRDAGGFHVHKDSGTLDEVYVLRVAVLLSFVPDVPPKGEAALKKHLLATRLDLVTLRYRHSLKLCAGKFESVKLLKRNDCAEELQELVDDLIGVAETNETDTDVSESA